MYLIRPLSFHRRILDLRKWKKNTDNNVGNSLLCELYYFVVLYTVYCKEYFADLLSLSSLYSRISQNSEKPVERQVLRWEQPTNQPTDKSGLREVTLPISFTPLI